MSILGDGIEAGDILVVREVETGHEIVRRPFTEQEASQGSATLPTLRAGVQYEIRVEPVCGPTWSPWLDFSMARPARP